MRWWKDLVLSILEKAVVFLVFVTIASFLLIPIWSIYKGKSETVTIRSPINGTVVDVMAEDGASVGKGGRIAHIFDDYHSAVRLLELEARLTAVNGSIDAARGDIARLSHISDELHESMQNYFKATKERLEAKLKGIKASISSAELDIKKTEDDVRGVQTLVSRKYATWKEENERVRAWKSALNSLEAKKAEMQGVLAEIESYTKGVTVFQGGGSEKPYAMQRRDEIAMKISALTATIETLSAERLGLERRIEVERAELFKRANVSIVADRPLRVVSVKVLKDGRVFSGDPIAEVVYCGSRC